MRDAEAVARRDHAVDVAGLSEKTERLVCDTSRPRAYRLAYEAAENRRHARMNREAWVLEVLRGDEYVGVRRASGSLPRFDSAVLAFRDYCAVLNDYIHTEDSLYAHEPCVGDTIRARNTNTGEVRVDEVILSRRVR